MALSVSLLLASKVQRYGQPVLTRYRDDFASLQARAALANEAEADVFVSIHANGFHTPHAHGTETYHWAGSTEGSRLAGDIQPRLVQATGLADRGVKTARFAVLRLTRMPAVLLELAFITNPEEEQLLGHRAWQDKVAAAIDEGLQVWRGEA